MPGCRHADDLEALGREQRRCGGPEVRVIINDEHRVAHVWMVSLVSASVLVASHNGPDRNRASARRLPGTISP